jgi:hypothetical protein
MYLCVGLRVEDVRTLGVGRDPRGRRFTASEPDDRHVIRGLSDRIVAESLDAGGRYCRLLELDQDRRRRRSRGRREDERDDCWCELAAD